MATKLTQSIQNNVNYVGLDRVKKSLNAQRAVINQKMNEAPFVRKMDKFSYILGSNLVIAFAYMIAKFPHDLVYTFSTIIMTFLFLHRCYDFYQKDKVWYLIDFCYVANFFLYYYINFAPKSQWIFITSFLFANGTIAFGSFYFRNSLVYHKIDMLTSVALHNLPMILTVHIKHFTIPA